MVKKTREEYRHVSEKVTPEVEFQPNPKTDLVERTAEKALMLSDRV